MIARTGATSGHAKLLKNPPEAVFASYLVRLSLNDTVDPYFIGAIVESSQYKRFIMANIGGAAQPNANAQVLTSFPLLLPPMAVQRKIGAVLAAYDDLIENNTRRIAILEEMARALYREWFVDFRFPGHESVCLTESALGRVPEGWGVVAVDDVCERVTDGSHFSPRSVDKGLPMASSKDMNNWGLNLQTCRYISQDDFRRLSRSGCRPKKNDVLITKDGANFLKHIFVLSRDQEVVLLSSVAILRPNERINPHLLAATLNAPENKERLKNYVTGAAIPRIILKDFKRFQILNPSRDIQQKWALVGEPMIELCCRLIEQVANLRATRDLLIPKLISGEVDVTELDIDVGQDSA